MATPKKCPLDELLKGQTPILLDNCLATLLESNGHDLRNHLWSTLLPKANPSAIVDTHPVYFDTDVRDDGVTSRDTYSLWTVSKRENTGVDRAHEIIEQGSCRSHVTVTRD